MSPVRLILVGGFLGAGKTTVLWEAAKRLVGQGRRVGLITNDQAPDLVDTNLLQGRGFIVREVAGSCFCCNFDGLLDAAEGLRQGIDADVLLAEPVGSCTDLSATILQPLKDRYKQAFELAPLSVLADPFRLRQVLTGEPGRMHPSAAYIFEKQLEEADLIVVNKSDRLSPEAREELRDHLIAAYPEHAIKWLSARTGEGMDDWLSETQNRGGSGTRIPEVDYDTYAEGEAVLGWLNAVVRLECPSGIDGLTFCANVLLQLRDQAASRNAEIGHIKLLMSAGTETVSGNMTGLDDAAEVLGAFSAPVSEAMVLLNARVQMAPEDLESLCRETFEAAAPDHATIQFENVHSLSPGRPVPTHRYPNVV